MNKFLLALCTLAITFSTNASAVPASIFDISISESFDSSLTKLQENCQTNVRVLSNLPVRFPLAKHTEQHLVCDTVKHGGKAAIVIADGKVAHINTNNISESAVTGLSDKYAEYIAYRAHSNHLLWLNTDTNSATLIGQDALHPNLFVWSNPHINNNQQSEVTLNTLLKFGASIDALMPIFEKHCHPLVIQDTKPWLLTKPNAQKQVNCFNFSAFGFPRKIEAVFGNNHLELAWILTASAEQTRVAQSLSNNYGKAIFENAQWQAYQNGEIYLRKDKPEVLAVSKRLIPLIKEKYALTF